MNIPYGLKEIKAISTYVCNYDEIGFDPNGRWNKVICNYKFFLVNKRGRCKQAIEHHSDIHYCIYPNRLAMIHKAHHCEPTKVVLLRYLLKNPTVTDSPPQNMQVYG